MSDVFISYSRKDEPFVRGLHTALAKMNRDVWVDWEDIPLTADWWREIQTGIEKANAFLFIISPDSARSEVCYREVDYALQNSKRIVPIVCRSISREDQAKMHPAVNRHNWVFFTDEAQFEQNFEALLAALDTNLAYIREHTRLLTRAKEWDSEGRENSFLLRGIDLQNAENLLIESTQHSEPKPTDLQTEYIFASRRAAAGRQRATLGSVVFGLLIAIGLAIFGLVSSQRAEANLLLSRQTQSLFLSDLSRQEREAGHYRAALLLALESVEFFPDIQNGESIRALLNALSGPQQKLIALPHEAESKSGLATVAGVRWNRDESRILSAFENKVLIWDSSSGDILLTLEHDADTLARGGIWNQDETRILSWSTDGTARVWDPFIENELIRLVHDLPVDGAFWIPGQGRIVTWVDGPTIRIWDANSGEALLTLQHEGLEEISSVLWRDDWLVASAGSRLHVWAVGEDDSGLYGQQHLQMQHEDTIKGIAWNPAAQQVLSWSDDGSVRVWDLATGQPVDRLDKGQAVEGAAWGSDGQKVLSWSRNAAPSLWDLPSQTSCVLGPAELLIQGGAWHSNSGQFITWSRDGLLRLWLVPETLDDQGCAGGVQSVLSFARSVEGARFSPDESRVLAWSQDGTARLWDPAAGDALVLDHNSSPVRDAAWSSDGSQVISTSLDNIVHVWTTAEQSDTQVLLEIRHDRAVAGAVWNPDQTLIVSWVSGETARIWNNEGVQQGSDLVHEGFVSGAAWNRDGSRILTWSRDGTARLWNNDGTPLAGADVMRHGDAVTGAVWNPAETQILTWSADNTACIWNSDASLAVPCMAHQSTVVGATWSRDGERVLTWSRDRQACVWDASSGLVAAGTACMQHREAVNGAAWDNQDARVLTWTRDRALRLWNPNGALLLEMPHSSAVQGAAWDPTGQRILSWAAGDTISVWDGQDSAPLVELPHGNATQGVRGATWNRIGSRILSWTANGIVRVWDVPSDLTNRGGETANGLLRAAMSHSRIVTGAIWNQDESQVLSWSADNTARIWDLGADDNPEELFVLVHNETVSGARWNDQENRVLSWTRGAVRQWIVDVNTLIAVGRGRVVEPFSNEERERFFLPTLVPTRIAGQTATP